MDGPPRAGQLGHCVAVPVLVPVTAPEARCLPGGRELGLSRFDTRCGSCVDVQRLMLP